MTQQEILVAINCLTYNHESYIRQCLEGFVTQKTKFRFVAIVHDDASTDNTAKIVREYADKYPDIIKPIFETVNQYSKKDGSLDKIINQAINETNCKYIAVCEGDDYWADSNKLQKQVSFLEKHSEYVLTHTSYMRYYEFDKKFYPAPKIQLCENDEISPISILSGKYKILTATTVFRFSIYKSLIESDPFLYSSGYFMMGDTPLWYDLSKKGKIKYFQDTTSVYRQNEGSATRRKNPRLKYRFNLSSKELRMYFCERDYLPNTYYKQIRKEYSKALIKYQCFDKDFKPLFTYDKKSTKLLVVLKNIGVLKPVLSFLVNYRTILGYIKRRLSI